MKRVKMLPLLVSLVICSALFFTMCDEIDDFVSKTSPVGVYVGIFSFAQGDGYSSGVKDLVPGTFDDTLVVNIGDPSLAYLSSGNLTAIQNSVLPTYVQGNTNGRPLVYAVDSAIKNLTNNADRLSNKLDNVTIISFSNGTDQGSGALFDKDNLPDYGQPVKNKIDTTTIRGVPINAWAIAIKDSGDAALQEQTLKYISSGATNAQGEEDYNYIIYDALNKNNLDTIFNSISDSLTTIKYAASLTIRVNDPASFIVGTTVGDSDGNNFCATFDGLGLDAPSKKYVKGKIQRNTSTNKWEIVNLKFTGIESTLQNADQCGKQGTYVDFGFTGLTGLGNNLTIKEYSYTTGDTWADKTGSSADIKVTQLPAEQKSAIVLLVLDATLSTTNISVVRAAASDFITRLYNASRKY